MQTYHNKVWLYFVEAVSEEYFVGFSSLGTTQWSIPPPDGEIRDVGLIPMLAVALAFQGKPTGDGVKRYSRQILDHVIAQANERGLRELCLTVNAANIRALKLYQNAGFQVLGSKDGRGNLHMLKLLD
jgi:GNAT superfamily N-acetyltransferase